MPAIGAIVSVIASLFSTTAGGAGKALESLAVGLGLRFYLGLAVGLVITGNHVRGDAIQLGKDIIGAVI